MHGWIRNSHSGLAFIMALMLLAQGCSFCKEVVSVHPAMFGQTLKAEFIQRDGECISRFPLARPGHPGEIHILEYGLKRIGEQYKGWLQIRSEKGRLLFETAWGMEESDLNNLLDAESDVQRERKADGKPYVQGADEKGLTIADWVKNIFSGRLHYGIETGEAKLEAKDLNQEYLEFYAKRFKTTAAKLQGEILGQPHPLRIAYRSTWRENYNEIVYAPSVNYYIKYGDGRY